MRGTKYGGAVKAEAVRLRRTGRFSLNEIAEKTGVPKTTLVNWMQKYPLTPEERMARRIASGRATRKDRGAESKFSLAMAGQALGRERKAKIAEAAVLFRLALHGFSVFGRVFDGEKADWLVRLPEQKKTLSIQVRWARQGKHGLPYISLMCANGRNNQRRYTEGEFDFLVGYDLFSDTAFVYSWADVAGIKATVTVSSEAAERWDRLT